MNSPFVIVKCDILQSAFSGEKVFQVPTADGNLFVGVAPIDSCRTSDGGKFGPSDPPRDKKASGFVTARVVRNGSNRARVAFPDGEDAVISTHLLRERPEECANVPV